MQVVVANCYFVDVVVVSGVWVSMVCVVVEVVVLDPVQVVVLSKRSDQLRLVLQEGEGVLHVQSRSLGHRVVAYRHRYRSLLQTLGSGLLDGLGYSRPSGWRKSKLRYQCGEYPE